MEKKAADTKLARQIFETIVHCGRQGREVRIVSEPRLPTLAVRWSRQDSAEPAVILLHPELLAVVENALRQLKSSPTGLETLGALWPLWRRVFLLLAYPDHPRDRFMERIEHTLAVATLSLHLFYKEEKEKGKLVPNRAGERWLAAERTLEAKRDGDASPRETFSHMVEELSFLRGRNTSWQEMKYGKVIVRDYLDALYLRLSIADLMPSSVEWMRSLALPSSASKLKEPPPVPPIGRCGIVDEEDQVAWKKLRSPMFEMGFYLLGQLGMGQFGRVYRAWNFGRDSLPPVVAIKVDRIRQKSKKEAIQEAETIMDIARSLSASPHVIRVFDAGKVRKKNWTYHVLQLVEGDTLDNLIGTTGMEHASILRPKSHRASEAIVREELTQSVKHSTEESWRRARFSSEFSYAPSLLQTLDLMTSKSLWVEEVHRLGFAVNDLKNGNIMINQRGQFKGIDLDSYAPIASPLDKLPDFFFLAISTFHLVTHGCKDPKKNERSQMTRLLADPTAMGEYLQKNWPWKIAPEHRALVREIQVLVLRYIDDCRSGNFARQEEAFGQILDRLIDLKREMSNEDLVLE